MAAIRSDDNPEVETRLLRTLYELSISAGRTPDPGELVQAVVEQACQLVGGDAVALYLWDDAAGLLMPVFSNDPRQPAEDQPIRPGQGAAGQAILQRQPLLIEDYQNWPHAISEGVARDLQSVQAVPLLLSDGLVGALIIRFYHRQRVFSPDLLRTLLLLAAQIAPALEAARLYATSSLERQHERALREITQALAANLDERQVLDLAVAYSAQLLKAPYARVWLLDQENRLNCAAAEGFVHADTFKRSLPGDSTSGLVAHQKILNLNNAPTEITWRFNREFGELTGLGSYLGAGLWRAGESLGVLEVMRQTGHRFSGLEEQLLMTLASAVAVAVSNARTHAALQRLAEQAEQRAEVVAESELMLRSIYEAIGSGVLVFDNRGVIINANAAAGEILGRSVDELLGMTTDQSLRIVREDGSPLPPDERPYPWARAQGEPIRKYVFGISRPDGQHRWLQADAVPLIGSDGTVTRIISSFIDITDQERSEAALRQRDTIFESVAFAAEQLLRASEWEHSIDDVLAQFGAATGVSRVYIMPGFYDGSRDTTAYEWTAPGVDSRPGPNVHGPYLASIGLARWEPILRAGGTIQGGLRTFPAAEQTVLEGLGVCSLVVVPIFDGEQWWGFIGFEDYGEEREWPSGAVEVLKTAAGTLGAAILRRRADGERMQLAREQSARLEAEAAQGRLAFLAEASQVLATSLDYETTLQGVADLVVPGLADCCFIDVREPDVIRRVASAVSEPFAASVGDLLGAQTELQGDHPIAVVIRTGELRLAEAISPRFRGRGARAFESAVIVPLVTRNGIAGAITWLVSAERPAYGAQDVGLAQDLARRCALAIDNASLYNEARVAISIRDEFMSVAAHELKTPMTSLRGYAQLLGREFEKDAIGNPERVRRAAHTIQVQADKLARLIAQLLDITRLQSGKLAIEPSPADLSSLIRDVVDGARNQLKQHTLIARLPHELPMWIDPLRMEQVLTNLVDNAIKYSPEGGQIDISVTVEAGVMRLTVRDHGVGVPIEHRPFIFDRFYQAHAGGALTSMAGMGLGLYISRQIIELHGGQIDAEFPENGGTCFVVTMPVGLP